MNFNPLAVLFWMICGLIGFLVRDIRGAAVGLLVGMSLSLVVAAFSIDD